MATITIDSDEIRVEPTRWQRFAGFQGAFSIPVTAVKSVRVDPEITHYFPGFRAPGYGGLVRKIGTFRRKGMKAYWNTNRHGDALVIECPGATYDRVVLTLDDPASVRDRIQAAKDATATPARVPQPPSS
jgi:hypothetical protein